MSSLSRMATALLLAAALDGVAAGAGGPASSTPALRGRGNATKNASDEGASVAVALSHNEKEAEASLFSVRANEACPGELRPCGFRRSPVAGCCWASHNDLAGIWGIFFESCEKYFGNDIWIWVCMRRGTAWGCSNDWSKCFTVPQQSLRAQVKAGMDASADAATSKLTALAAGQEASSEPETWAQSTLHVASRDGCNGQDLHECRRYESPMTGCCWASHNDLAGTWGIFFQSCQREFLDNDWFWRCSAVSGTWICLNDWSQCAKLASSHSLAVLSSSAGGLSDLGAASATEQP